MLAPRTHAGCGGPFPLASRPRAPTSLVGHTGAPAACGRSGRRCVCGGGDQRKTGGHRRVRDPQGGQAGRDKAAQAPASRGLQAGAGLLKGACLALRGAGLEVGSPRSGGRLAPRHTRAPSLLRARLRWDPREGWRWRGREAPRTGTPWDLVAAGWVAGVRVGMCGG